MKITTFRALLGMMVAFGSAAIAHAANPFVAGSHWTGFRVSAVGGGSSSAVLNVSNNPAVGVLTMVGQNIPVSISCTPTGVVDLQGLGVNFVGVHAHGTVAAQGGTYSLTSSYTMTGVPGTHNDTGRLSLLRSYKTISALSTPIVIGRNPGEGLLPPGPCFGSFVNSAGFVGRMVFEHDLPPVTNERSQPSDFTGDIYMQDFHFRVVGTINPDANADGTHSIELLGENVVVGHPFSTILTTGLLLPAVQTNPMSILGNYSLIGLLRTGDVGRFQVSQ